MLKQRASSLEEKFLKKFTSGKEIQKLEDEREIQTFQILQRFDLIRAGAAGKFRITSKGEYALGVGVRKYLANLRLERKLFRDYMKAKVQNRWLMVFGILLAFLFTLFVFFQV